MICINCAMRAMLNNEPPPMFDETPEEHMRRVHPDPYVAGLERKEMEILLERKKR